MATGKFVSHITGFATLFGVGLIKNKISAAIGILTVPIFFLFGSFIAGLLVDRPLFKNEKPRFDIVMGLSSTCLILSALGGNLIHFANFGIISDLKENYVLLVLLCLASGLQNGAITSSSGSSVRTTHLTGLTTDLGLGLSRMISFGSKDEIINNELRANYLRIGSILAFVGGSAIGAFVFLQFGYFGFLLPAFISAYAALYGRNSKISPRRF